MSKTKKSKTINRKMTTNSQLSTTEHKKTKTKQTTRTGTESQKWRSHGGLSVGSGRGKMGDKVQAISGWKEVFKVMKGRDLHPRLLYPAKL